MSYRPYPSVDRARHQVDRHDDEAGPQSAAPERPLTTAQAIEQWAAMMRAAAPTAQQLAAAWTAALKKRPASSEEKTT